VELRHLPGRGPMVVIVIKGVIKEALKKWNTKKLWKASLVVGNR